MKPCSIKFVLLAIVGLIFVITGIVFCFFWPRSYGIFDSIIDGKLPLTSKSWGSRFWNETRDSSKNVEFYFFNWTNPEELTITGKKPNFVEIGPYSFIEKIQKVNVTHYPRNNTVSFDELKFWYFDEEKSIGKLTDNITQLNVLAVFVAHRERYSPFNQNTLSFLLKTSASKLYTKQTVSELLFDGYEDELIKKANAAFRNRARLPDRFGWYYMKNGTLPSGNVNMGTGEDDLSNFGMIEKWNYKDTTSYYETSCNHVEGSAGEFWPPTHDTEDITKWMPELCRPVTYEYIGETTHQDMSGYKYSIGEKTLGNNECYCNGECSPIGLVNITTCRNGAPIFISLPHFHKGESILREQIVGMNPNDINHSSYITLDPNTGIPLDATARIQMNVLLEPSSTVSLLKNVTKMYFPLFWINFKSEMTERSADTLRSLLILPSAVLYGCILLVILGALILLIVVWILYLRSYSEMFRISTRRAYDGDDEGSELHEESFKITQESFFNERLI